MAVTAFYYARFFISLANKLFDIVGGTDDVYVQLTTSSYTPNQDTHDFEDDVTNEVTGTGYTAGGVQLTSDDFTQSANVLTWDSDDPSWTGASFTSRISVYYGKLGGASSADPLVNWVDFGGDETVSSGTFTIQQNASGIATVTVADA